MVTKVVSKLKQIRLREFINNIQIKSKLIALITIFTIFILAIGVVSVSYITKINNSAKSMYENDMMANLYLSQISQKNLELQKLEIEYVLGDYNMDQTEIKNNIEQVEASIPELYSKLTSLQLTPYTLEKLKDYEAAMNETIAEREKVESRILDNRKIEAYMYYQNRLSKVRNDAIAILADITEHNLQHSEEVNVENEQGAKSAINWMIVTIVILLAVIAIVFIHIYRHIKYPIAQLSKEMEKVKQGNLDININYIYNNELGALSQDFIAMTDEINRMVGQMKANAEHVAKSSSELLEGTTQMREFSSHMSNEVITVANHAETQVQHMNESVRAMEEVAKGISRINESAIEVAELSSQANNYAFNGRETMQTIAAQMQSILEGSTETYRAIEQFSKTSTEISKFVMTIEEISRQVQLLALNASIEAARAGEYGRGFAVVATEVRELAEHTKDASQSIGKMVRAIQSQANSAVQIVEKEQQEVSQGMKDVAVSEAIFAQITDAVQTINAQLQEVSASTEEMSASAEQVTSSLQEVSHLSQSSSKQSLQVLELAKQQLYIMGDIQNYAEGLDKVAENLNIESAKFNVKQ